MKSIVDRQLAELKSRPAAALSLAQLDPLSTSNPTLRSLSVNIDPNQIADSLGTVRPSGEPITSARSGAPPRSPARLGIGLTLLALAGVGAYVGISRSSQPPATQVQIQEVRLQVRALPASARITLDDGRQLENPYLGSVDRDDREHRVRVEAEGYEPTEERVRFDKDVALDIKLQPIAAAPPVDESATDEVAPESSAKPSAKPTHRGGGRKPSSSASAAPSAPAPAPAPTPSGKPKRKLDDGEMWP
jgi:hypothetical protein